MDGRGMEEAGVDDRVVSIVDIRDAPSNAHGHLKHHPTQEEDNNINAYGDDDEGDGPIPGLAVIRDWQ